VKTVFGAVLVLVSVVGFEWGAKVLASGWDAAGQEVSREGLNVGALVLAYGLGLAPLVVGMLLLEAAYDYQRKWASIIALLPTFYAVTRWGALSNQLHKIHDKAYVPSVLMLIGVIGVAGWATSLWIRLRRAELKDIFDKKKKSMMDEVRKELAAEKAARKEAVRKAQEKGIEPGAAERSAEKQTGEGTSKQAT
jgi:hypothetical protein